MITVRIRFEKTGEAAYISLLDLQRVFHRILKRSGLPVYYTQGFNPHIYLSFACPLSLGQESLCECCEVKTEAEDPQLDTWCDVLQPYMPRGIKVLSALQALGDSQGALENYYLGQIATDCDETPEQLARALREVTKERIMAAAQSARLDTVYFLHGKEEA